VQPRDTKQQVTANLTIKPDSSVGAGKTFNVSARVMPPVNPANAALNPIPEKMSTKAVPSATPASAIH
jgi:hypothetical protein